MSGCVPINCQEARPVPAPGIQPMEGEPNTTAISWQRTLALASSPLHLDTTDICTAVCMFIVTASWRSSASRELHGRFKSNGELKADDLEQTVRNTPCLLVTSQMELHEKSNHIDQYLNIAVDCSVEDGLEKYKDTQHSHIISFHLISSHQQPTTTLEPSTFHQTQTTLSHHVFLRRKG